MAANKTTKPSAKPKAKTTAKRVAETSKKVVAKTKATAKAPVKTKIVPKITAKAPVAAHGKSAKTPAAAKTAKGAPKIETNGKKSIVNLAAKKLPETKPVAQAAKDKATLAIKQAVANSRLAMAAKAPASAAKPAAAPLKTASAARTVAAPAAKPEATKVALQAKPVATQPQAKVAPKAPDPAIVLALKKLPVNGKPAVPVASTGKPAQPEAKALPPKVSMTSMTSMAPVVDPKKPVKPATQRHGFRTNEYIVYPSHGVGKIVRIEEQVVAGYSLELFVIHFEQEKMTLRVPTAKLASVGMRKLSEMPIVERAMETLKGRARIKRTMWSRRAQEYEAKINSGDLVSIAEVVRDLYRAETQPEQSYSERQLFEAALDRMSREIAAIENLDDRGATQKVLDVLSKSAKNRKAIEAAAPEVAANAAGAERAA